MLPKRSPAEISELEATLRLRDEFLLAASHDLKTPLSVMQLLVDGLRQWSAKQPPDEGLAKKLDVMQRQVTHMERLINKLLDVAHIDARELRMVRQEMDLAALVREVVERCRDQIDWARCSLTVHADQAVVGRWDRTRLDEVVSNLVGNAIKYGHGSPISVEVSSTPVAARVVVRDQGIGIAAVDQARIFEKFHRTDEGRAYAGMGLGLWIVSQVVAGHGGTIRVHSTVGSGSTFTVELPLGLG